MPDRRELGSIAYQDHSTAYSAADIADEVLEQVSRPECRLGLCASVNAYEGDLIHDKEGVFGFVGGKRKQAEAVIADRFLTVYLFMDCVGRTAGIH